MGELFKNKRFAYIKSSNAAEELKYLSDSPSFIPDGPLTFISQFLSLFGKEKTLLLSFGSCNGVYSSGSCKAISYKRKLHFMGPLGSIISEVRRFILVFYHLLWFSPDYILCASYRQSLWASFLVAKILNCTLIHSRHNRIEPAKGILRKIIWAIDKAIISRIPIICHGTYLKKQLIEIGVPEKQICEFQPGYRQFYETAMANNRKFEDITDGGKRIIIGFIGRIVSEKGVFDLLDACYVRMQENSSITLLYVGSGPALEELIKKCSSLQLEKQIITTGQIPHDHLGNIIQQCKFVVTPTQSVFPEGFGMAALEPMIFGKPVIVPDFGPFPSFVLDSINGLFYHVDSVASLTCSINRLLDDQELYAKLSEGARTTGEDALDPKMTYSKAIIHAFASGRGIP